MTRITPRRRSVLFLPASNARAIEKARTLPCDAIILDLEDAVAPDAKAAARDAAVAAAAIGFGDRELIIRINALDSEWAAADIAAVRSSKADGVLLPKISRATDLATARGALDGKPIWAMVETCTSILNLAEIADAAADNRLVALVAGTNDLAKEMRCRPDTARSQLVPALVQIVIAARAAGIAAIDGVLNAIEDGDRLAAECSQGSMLGFDGKTLIHPSQIDTANAAFSPDEASIAWAKSVVAAFADAGNDNKGAIRLNGAMIERLHLVEARQILALAKG